VAVAAAAALDHVGLPEAQYALAQATTYIATAPKSNRSGAAYWAAVGDLDERGALPVPTHLRNAGHRALKQYGYGVGYRYPPEFEGSDIAQQYLPDELAERRYYLPNDQGYEATIASRMAARVEAREATRRRGRPERESIPGPKADSMKAAGSIMRAREESRRKLAETEKRDAGGS
jgi:putative ATPase